MNELQNIYLHAQSLSLDMDDKVLTTLLPSSALQSAFIVGQDKPETSTNLIYCNNKVFYVIVIYHKQGS